MMFHEKVKALALEAHKNMHTTTDDRLRDYYSGEVGAYLATVTMATGETAFELLQELVNNYHASLNA
jgi:hypothetical protein